MRTAAPIACCLFAVAHVVFAEAREVSLSALTRGSSADAGGAVEYVVTVRNTNEQAVAVSFSVDLIPWAAMSAALEPSNAVIAAGAETQVVLRVTVPARVPPGGHEPQVVRAIANPRPAGAATGAVELKFVTARRLEHPNILFTQDGWDAIRAKCGTYDWARAQKDDLIKRAEGWGVPGVRNPSSPKRGDWLFATQAENGLMDAGIAYQLSGDPRFAEKVRTFLLRLSDPTNGFPVTRRGCNQASVQEGHFFQHIAMAYDMAMPSGVFTDADRAQIDETLRLFVGEERDLGSGNISNWSVSWNCGALYCALDLQDLGAADWILNTPGGIFDQFRRGTLDDGWWYECSISYNTWCATEFSQVALAMRPWGYNIADMHFPSNYRPADEQTTPPDREEYGMSKVRWGPIHHNYINIKRMWDALPAMLDYRGVMFGLNDSAERNVGGAAMDIAYYLYRDPAYAASIRSGGGRDLLYGVPELPETPSNELPASVFADNAGVAVLRSQTADRGPREQIQAVLHYGDHGWYHGHFDRTGLLHLSRYGVSFYNPEFIWYGYPNYMYKFYVQTSVSKNMVVVDQKMQEPVESHRLLFHSGPMMQAAAVETRARWSNPPYGGMVYGDQGFTNFADKALAEGRSVPAPTNPPAYGAVTDYTEPVLQRRLMIVADDYVVLADYLKAEREHTFDCTFQLGGFKGIDGEKPARHAGQWNPDPVSSAQFVTDCDWYETAAPALGHFEFQNGGKLKMDLHGLWPPKQEIMVAQPPEAQGGQRVVYTIKGDGKTLLEGETGAWILGAVDVDVPVQGVKTLELLTNQRDSANLFWVGANVAGRVVTNDAQGGPIKVEGIPYPSALPAHTTIDLGGQNVTRFKARLGRDYPNGDESQKRKTVAIRSNGKEARFLTVIEPFEDKAVVKSATASSPSSVRVELTDGRIQEIEIRNLDGNGGDILAEMRESRGGAVVRTETAQGR